MGLFETLQQRLGCEFISDLPFLWRTHQKSFAFIVLRLDFDMFTFLEWIDLCDYLQISFEERDLLDKNSIRALFMRYA